MKHKVKKIISRHKSLWSQRTYWTTTFTGLVLLVASLLVNRAADYYTMLRASNPVTDIILDNIPVFNVNFIFFYGFAIFWTFVIVLLVHDPKKIPFALKSIAVFIVVRSIFISLTHMATPLEHSYLDPGNIFHAVTSSDDLFFSSHTGLPFLMALIFWENKYLKIIFIAASLFFGTSVLLGHLHYSIDVFAAFFITYGIFQMSRTFFKKDLKLFSAA